jgi:hypothetical protein
MGLAAERLEDMARDGEFDGIILLAGCGIALRCETSVARRRYRMYRFEVAKTG